MTGIDIKNENFLGINENLISVVETNENLIPSIEANQKICHNAKVYEDIELAEPIFVSSEVPDKIYEKMLGNSIMLKDQDEVNIKDYSYLQVSYYGFDNKTHIGEMIVNRKVVNDVLSIFKELYDIRYPIEKIKLIDEYGGDDELSMEDNNTSCFCYRKVQGTKSLSNHAKGMAIDINPLYNPYIAGENISPASAVVYADRGLKQEYQINKNDDIYKIFAKYGWSWGGDWKSKKDYQHFEKR